MLRAFKALSLLLAVWLAAPVVAPVVAAAAPVGSTSIYPLQVEDLSSRIAGRPSDYTATLVAGEVAVPDQTLTLWLRPAGSTTFVESGQATTDANGSATVWATLQRNASVQWRYSGGSYDASASLPYGVQIAPRVTARVNDRTLRRGQRFVATGRTFPAKAGCTVTLWRGELRPLVAGPTPVRLARTTARADGSYRLVRRFHRKARMRVAVTVSACAGNARGLSPYVGIRVR